jgi:hypothetical protein
MPARRKRAGTPGRGALAPTASRAVLAAWDRLSHAVAEALAVLGEDQCLVLSSKRRGYFVQLVSLGADGVHAEAVSNSWLRPKHALDAGQIARLGKLGWAAPNVTRAQIDAAEDADSDAERPVGSSNYFRDWEGPPPFSAIADLVMTTLREVYGIRKPEQLEYVAFAPGPREILLPTLGIGNLPLADEDEDDEDEDHIHEGELLRPEDADELRDAVLEALKSFTDLADPSADEDGDIPLRYGSALLILRADSDAPFVGLDSPLLTGIAPSVELHEALADLMRSHRQVRFYIAARTVHAAVDLIADPFVPDHLGATLAVMGRLCDETGPELQHRFGGSTAFEEEPPARPKRRKVRYN